MYLTTPPTPDLTYGGKASSLYKASIAIISLPFSHVSSLYPVPHLERFYTPQQQWAIGLWKQITQNGQVHLGIAKRFGPIIGITSENCNTLITQMILF